MYLKSSLSFNHRKDFMNEFEVISVDIAKPNCKAINVTALYRPPNCTNLENIVRVLDVECKELLILGDLNCNYLAHHSDSQLSQLKQLSTVYQLTQLINVPTRITPNSSTLIDVILTNEPSRIITSGVLHIGISDHSLVYAVRKFAIPSNNTHKYVTTRSFKNFDANKFKSDLVKINWNSIHDQDSPDEMLERWYELFTHISNKHTPIRTRRVRNKKAPWLTPELRNYSCPGFAGYEV